MLKTLTKAMVMRKKCGIGRDLRARINSTWGLIEQTMTYSESIYSPSSLVRPIQLSVFLGYSNNLYIIFDCDI